MRISRISKTLGVAAAATLALTACGGGGDSNSSGEAGDGNAIITADSVEPQNPLCLLYTSPSPRD